MNQQEAAALLSVAAAFDNRKPDPDAALAWSVALDGLRFEDCRDAVIAHYKTSSEWLMPTVVIREVKRIRDQRIKDYGLIPMPDDMDPDDTVAYQRYLRTARQAIADGRPLPAPEQVKGGSPMPKELGQAIERFGRMDGEPA